MTIPLIYVAGPFSPTSAQKAEGLSHRAAVEQNIRNASLLGLGVAKLGACPWIPHANTALPEFETVQPYTFWIEATAEQLCRCDGVIFTDDFQASSGAVGEERIAIEHGITRFYNLAVLGAWLKWRAAR